jgi:hypothetical protein
MLMMVNIYLWTAVICWFWIEQTGRPTFSHHYSFHTFSSACLHWFLASSGGLAFCTLLLSSSYHSLFSNTKFSVFYFGNISCHLFSSLHREEIGRWIAFIAVVLRLFVPRHFPGMIHVIIVCVLSTYLLSLLLYIYTLLSSNCPIITSKLYR